ncbi:hypothetical protein CDD82_7757 [Ophiocordyceps australis]|uniref:Uncharacterized protein n=1 Tax=Ophiocordyceps australis TaxID=1399860 RepID=A0A2C5ZPT5_9HYPO|nr:hypothetical protein CDD82_7757 [Ophiocordyceps australis]
MKYTILTLAGSTATAFAQPQQAWPRGPKYTPECEEAIYAAYKGNVPSTGAFCGKIAIEDWTIAELPIHQAIRSQIQLGCNWSEKTIFLTCRKILPEIYAPAACRKSIYDMFFDNLGRISEFCKSMVNSGKTLREILLNSPAIQDLLHGGCQDSEPLVKSSCEYIISDANPVAPSQKCSETISLVFSQDSSLPRYEQYIPFDYCRDVINGYSSSEISELKHVLAPSLNAILQDCDSAEAVIKATCRKYYAEDPGEDRTPMVNPVANGPTHQSDEGENVNGHTVTEEESEPIKLVTRNEPPVSMCRIDCKPCNWSECDRFIGTTSQYNPETGMELMESARSTEEARDGNCKYRFGPPCENGLYRQLWCGRRETPDCVRSGRECYWVGSGPWCPDFLEDSVGKMDVYNRVFSSAFNHEPLDPEETLDECDTKAQIGFACKGGAKQLWCM